MCAEVSLGQCSRRYALVSVVLELPGVNFWSDRDAAGGSCC